MTTMINNNIIFNIRAIFLDEWPIFKKLRLSALLEFPELFGGSYKDERKLSLPEFQANFKNCVVFGAFIGDELVGSICFYRHHFFKMNHRGFLFFLYVTAKNRKQGIANALIQFAINYAKFKIEQIHVSVITINDLALTLYKKHQFEIYAIEPRVLKLNKIYYDEYKLILYVKK